ncbi:MAG: hypothetical protein J2P30_16110 [Actinobacteria bacterium]|nr:hypothetical protein [Actinomycetota bacterium]
MSWSAVGNLRGPEGPPGPEGAHGGDWRPEDQNLLAANFDPLHQPTDRGLDGERVFLLKIPIREPMTVSRVVFQVWNPGSGQSTGTFAGVYSSSGVRLGVSADVGELWYQGYQPVFLPLAAPAQLEPGWVWAALLMRLPNRPSVGTMSDNLRGANVGLPITEARFCCAGWGWSSLPPSFDPANENTLDNARVCWCGLD